MVNIPGITSTAVSYTHLISLTGISFSVSLPKEHLQYNVDQEALTKVVSNLLTNAMKYARSRIMVILDEHLSAEGRTLSICVRDDGPGIPQDECSKVFEPFYQVGNAGNNGSGVGIGLSLVKLLDVYKRQPVAPAICPKILLALEDSSLASAGRPQ